MAIGSSIMDLFRSTTAVTPPPAATPPNPNDPTNKGNATVPGANTVTSDGSIPAIPKAGEGETSPLEGFKDLWQAPGKDAKRPATEGDLVPKLSVEPKKLLEAASKVDFVKHIPKEKLEAAAKGDVAALAEVINSAGQLGYAQSANATAALIEQALTRQAAVFKDQVMPEILRRHEVSASLQEDNPLFQNPAVKPVLDSIERQFLAKNPSASAAEVSKMAKEYVSVMASEILKANGMEVSEKPQQTQKGSTRGNTDWEKWFGVNT